MGMNDEYKQWNLVILTSNSEHCATRTLFVNNEFKEKSVNSFESIIYCDV